MRQQMRHKHSRQLPISKASKCGTQHEHRCGSPTAVVNTAAFSGVDRQKLVALVLSRNQATMIKTSCPFFRTLPARATAPTLLVCSTICWTRLRPSLTTKEREAFENASKKRSPILHRFSLLDSAFPLASAGERSLRATMIKSCVGIERGDERLMTTTMHRHFVLRLRASI